MLRAAVNISLERAAAHVQNWNSSYEACEIQSYAYINWNKGGGDLTLVNKNCHIVNKYILISTVLPKPSEDIFEHQICFVNVSRSVLKEKSTQKSFGLVFVINKNAYL